MKPRVAVAGIIAALLISMPAAAAERRQLSILGIDWSAIIQALRLTLTSWRYPGGPTPTASPSPSSTATNAIPTSTSTRTSTPTRTATSVPTFTPTPQSIEGSDLGLEALQGIPPAQKLASALIVFPYIVFDGSTDTLIELYNMSGQEQTIQCFYVRQSDCNEIGFFVTLTADQPLSWRASEGTNNVLTFTAVPPFDGVGELKCAVAPRTPNLSSHNVLQGRAIVFDPDGETVGYGAIGFQRLVPGDFPGVVDLDGGTYEQCPDRLHFQVLARQTGSNSDLVLAPCSQDLLTQTPTVTTVQLKIINEFEQVLSASLSLKCHLVSSFSRISTLSYSVLGTQTAHLVVRGTSSPLLGLVIDRFTAYSQAQTTVNEPFLDGGRSATVIFP
jgi:hypothetical protein